MTKLEGLARAVYEKARSLGGALVPWDDIHPKHRHFAIEYARAVLLALREVDEGMAEAGGKAVAGAGEFPTPNRARLGFQAMIDQVLEEKDGDV